MAIKPVYGSSSEGFHIKGWSVRAIGINNLVKMAKSIDAYTNRLGYKFRALNKELKPKFKTVLLQYLRKSCDEKGKLMRPKGHLWIKNSLEVIPGGAGRGISALQVITTNPNTAKFAHIYDVGGTIRPIKSKYLTVPTRQFQAGLSYGLPMSWDRERTPSEVYGTLKAKGIKTFAIPLHGSGPVTTAAEMETSNASLSTGEAHVSKLVVAKIKTNLTASNKVKAALKEKFQNAKGLQKSLQPYRQVGIYLLADWIKVKPSYWARDGVIHFVTDAALPMIRKESQIMLSTLRKEVGL